MAQDFLSNIELYFHPSIKMDKKIEIEGYETKHMIQVMRHKTGDTVYVTNGNGEIYKCIIESIEKLLVNVKPVEKISYNNNMLNITFCIPLIKNFDRLEFALEKLVELGITNFIFYRSERSISKNPKMDRWEKISVAAMKQSLRSFLPKIDFVESIEQIIKKNNNILLLDQNAKNSAKEIIEEMDLSKEYCFLFGPEGGFDNKELQLLDSSRHLRLTRNRLRSETAVIYLASLIASAID